MSSGPKLKIGILTSNESNYSNKRLMEEGEKRGHEMQLINFLKCDAIINHQKSIITYEGRSLEDIDVVIPRIGSGFTFFAVAIVRHFEMMKKMSLNGSLGISRSKDKLRSLQILARKGIPLPTTAFSHNTLDSKGVIKAVGGAPVVIKLIEGMQGIGVVLAETLKAAESVIDAFRGLKANLIVQEFIEEASGKDLRCFVLGDQVIASMVREAKDGDFRSNLHRGGASYKAQITSEERRMAIKAAKELRLSVAGVDIIRSDRGPLVLEVNSSPGLEGIETTTGENIANKMIEYIEKTYVLKMKEIHREPI